MARFLLRAEAVASSNIEGLRINVRRLARSEAAAQTGAENSDETTRAVIGNIHSLDEALRIATAKGVIALGRNKRGPGADSAAFQALLPGIVGPMRQDARTSP